jgi:hypothetical protein
MWRLVSGVVICKPRKCKYIKHQGYRSIPLLSWMGIVVEKVVAELLPEDAERRGLLSDCNYWSRPRRLAIDPAAILVDRAHPARREGHIAGILLIIFKAGFLSIGGGD